MAQRAAVQPANFDDAADVAGHGSQEESPEPETKVGRGGAWRAWINMRSAEQGGKFIDISAAAAEYKAMDPIKNGMSAITQNWNSSSEGRREAHFWA